MKIFSAFCICYIHSNTFTMEANTLNSDQTNLSIGAPDYLTLSVLHWSSLEPVHEYISMLWTS